MFYSKSIYALNKKDRDAIVYEDSDGSLIRLTRENFPSQEEFLRFKAWSDENYHVPDLRRRLCGQTTPADELYRPPRQRRRPVVHQRLPRDLARY